MVEPEITADIIKNHGLTEEEFERIKQRLGRSPNYTELGVFSVMWSEHCSYKNTRPLLKQFPTKSKSVLVGAGEENAGILDIGDGLAVAFKIESHNHPSAVEPFQGAATGVGGILRDIFTMGARPICAANSLRFGPLSSPEVQRLLKGVVAGIGHYGNCFGVPMVAGEVYFDPSYEGNPLVNAFALGVLRHAQIARGAAKGIGNPVFYVGPATGRDGLAGAAFASQDLTEESAEQQRGAVQVGDPFMEKLLLEACLELLGTGAVAGIQDMGAAGLTCSACETAARGGTGIEINLNKVPQRAPNMTPCEIMLSESQERMLIIVHKGREAEVKRIFDKWDLPWAEIGFVTDTGRMVVRHEGEVVVDLPARELTDEAPIYHRDSRRPAYLDEYQQLTLDQVPFSEGPQEALLRLLAWPTIASKNWVYRQYDYTVRSSTVLFPGSDAAVVRVKEDSLPEISKGSKGDEFFVEKYLALTVDCNATYVYLDPYEGGRLAVAESARNLACSGALPLGVTNNLNYGNPHDPELFWQLKESVRGIAEACAFFDTPVTGGNVSLYNQNPNGAIDPTPVIAMVGQIEDEDFITSQWFKEEGDVIVLLGNPVDIQDPLLGLGGSAYLQVIEGRKTGHPPRVDFAREKQLADALRGWIGSGVIKSAHDCSEGGLAVALSECCVSRDVARQTPSLVGAGIRLEAQPDICAEAMLFGESQSRIIVTVSKAFLPKVIGQAEILKIPVAEIGVVGGDRLCIQYGTSDFSWKLDELYDAWWSALKRQLA
ncbi:MAG: Phosphoribosylformylglycinamidine synthase subunit PurL [Verrucomicrobia subdivision 3 bacterium]|nr:Phosphoribosylformylglycinamidine synthase subunit PurL [Limisphaerales bacterium]MCS1415279.1 Phosphoribosylformylglycinamidine synthase subunit PurL [Limisphaerales bacterium]